MNSRNKEIDVLRGILIFFVVLGHSTHGPLHDFIFLFHMPLFFMMSGTLISKNRLTEKEYFLKKVKQLMIPYFAYGILDTLFIRHNAKLFLRFLWGGRAIGFVYWYATCYLFSLLLLIFLMSNFSEKICKSIILAGGGYSSIGI